LWGTPPRDFRYLHVPPCRLHTLRPMVLALQILGAVAALALGIWLGLPGRYDRRPDEIDRAMGAPGGRTKKVKRHFTPMAWVRRQIKVSTGGGRSRGGGGGRGFTLERPDRDRTQPSSDQGGAGAFKLRRPSEGAPSRRGSAGRSSEPAQPDAMEPSSEVGDTRRDQRLKGRFKLRRPGERGS